MFNDPVVTFYRILVVDKVLSLDHSLDSYKLFLARCDGLGAINLKSQGEASTVHANEPIIKKQDTNVIAAEIDRDIFEFIKENNEEKFKLALQNQKYETIFQTDKVFIKFQNDKDKQQFLVNVEEFKYQILLFDPMKFTTEKAWQDVKSFMAQFNDVPGPSRSVSFVVYDEGFVKVVGKDVPLFYTACSKLEKCIRKAEERNTLITSQIDVSPNQAKLLIMSDAFNRFVLILSLTKFHLLNAMNGKIGNFVQSQILLIFFVE